MKIVEIYKRYGCKWLQNTSKTAKFFQNKFFGKTSPFCLLVKPLEKWQRCITHVEPTFFKLSGYKHYLLGFLS